MVEVIGILLRNKIVNLPYVGKVSGIVSTRKESIPDGQMPFIARYPIGKVLSNPVEDACSQEYVDMSPTDQQTYVSFFEDHGSHLYSSGTEIIVFNVRYIQWMNLNSAGEMNNDRLLGNLIQAALCKNLTGVYNHPLFKYIKCTVDSIPRKSEALFARYSFDEASEQYLNWPYDYFAIDLSIECQLRLECVSDPDVNLVELCNSGQFDSSFGNSFL